MSEIERLELKVDHLSEQLATLVEAQRKRDELLSDMTPILRVALAATTTRLESAEKKGYFSMGKGLLRLVDRVVEAYSPEDLEELGENVVAILDTIRALTQPEVMSVVGEIAEAAEGTDTLKPIGLLGAARAAQEQDAKRGMAVLIEVIKRLGKGVHKVNRRRSLSAQLGSRKNGGRPGRPAPVRSTPRERVPAAPAPAPTASPQPAQSAAVPTVAGVQLTSEGFLVDSHEWSQDVAEKMAQFLGITLTESHLHLIEKAREDYAATKMSPNIRRLTIISGLSTKELYQMFPKAPGKCAAMVAGLPKPAGCI